MIFPFLRIWLGRLFFLESCRNIKLKYPGHNILLIVERARCAPIEIGSPGDATVFAHTLPARTLSCLLLYFAEGSRLCAGSYPSALTK